MQKHTTGMFLTDFHMQKYTGGIISRVGIFLTVTPADILHLSTAISITVFLHFGAER